MAMAAMRNVGREGEGGEGWWPPIQSVIMSIIFMNAAIVFRRTIPNIVEPLLVSLSLGVTHENPTRVAVLEMIVYIVAAAVVGAMMLACETFASTFVLGALMAGVAVGLPRTLSVLCERRAAGYLPWLALLFFAASAGFEVMPNPQPHPPKTSQLHDPPNSESVSAAGSRRCLHGRGGSVGRVGNSWRCDSWVPFPPIIAPHSLSDVRS